MTVHMHFYEFLRLYLSLCNERLKCIYLLQNIFRYLNALYLSITKQD